MYKNQRHTYSMDHPADVMYFYSFEQITSNSVKLTSKAFFELRSPEDMALISVSLELS